MNGVLINGNGEVHPPQPPAEPVERPPTPPPAPPIESAPPPPPMEIDAPPSPSHVEPPPPPEDVPPPPPPAATAVKKKKTGWGSSGAAPKPLSVEELLRKKREADAAASKVRLSAVS